MDLLNRGRDVADQARCFVRGGGCCGGRWVDGVSDGGGVCCGAANQITATSADTTTWTYDAAGNQTRNGITGLTQTVDDRSTVTALGATTYTAFGSGNTEQLTRSGGTTYTTSGLGLATQTASATTTAFTRDANGTATGARIGAIDVYYATDHLGSVTGLFNDTGTWLGGYSYSPYGETRATATGATVAANPLRYISGHLDASTGLYKFGARYYDPTLGRFTQIDPSGQEANPYAYAACNPINATDRTGLSLSPQFICGLQGVIIGAIATVAVGLAFPTAGASIVAGVIVGVFIGVLTLIACDDVG